MYLYICIQVLTAKLGIVAKKDLAQQCRLTFPAWANRMLWLTAEIAIAATDLAEVSNYGTCTTLEKGWLLAPNMSHT